MLGPTFKIILPQQAKILNIYKTTKYKLLKANTAIWFNN
jgi:DNA gyrase/topoisomerase IV subunit B